MQVTVAPVRGYVKSRPENGDNYRRQSDSGVKMMKASVMSLFMVSMDRSSGAVLVLRKKKACVLVKRSQSYFDPELCSTH